MPSGLTETSIYNLVLDRLAQESVLSTTDQDAATRWLNRNYAHRRDVLLAKHPWNFAVKRVSLAADTDRPAFEWCYQYSKPGDCLRVLPITTDGRRESPQVPFVVEGDKILTNLSAPLKFRYIYRVTDPGLFSPLFTDTLAMMLAWNFAFWLTGKASFAKMIQDSLPSIIADAQLIDSLEGLPEPPDDNEIILVR